MIVSTLLLRCRLFVLLDPDGFVLFKGLKVIDATNICIQMICQISHCVNILLKLLVLLLQGFQRSNRRL